MHRFTFPKELGCSLYYIYSVGENRITRLC